MHFCSGSPVDQQLAFHGVSGSGKLQDGHGNRTAQKKQDARHNTAGTKGSGAEQQALHPSPAQPDFVNSWIRAAVSGRVTKAD